MDPKNDLHDAAATGDLKTVKRLLSTGIDIDSQKETTGTALCAAARCGRVDVLQLLLDSGANVNIAVAGIYDGNALRAAALNRDHICVKMLLDHGADVNAQDDYLGNALHAAAFSGSDICVKMLLDHGADINAQSHRYGNALQAAARSGNELSVKILLDHGADVNHRGGSYDNAVQAAAEFAHENLIKILIDYGADVNVQSGRGSPLQAAVWKSDAAKVKLLLEYGARINEDVLQKAVKNGNKRVLRILLEACPGVIALDFNNYKSALEVAMTTLQRTPSPKFDPDSHCGPGFTVGHVRRVWEDGLNEYKEINMSLSTLSYVEDWAQSGRQRRALLARRLCTDLYQYAQNEQDHFEQLDRRLLKLLPARFDKPGATKGMDEDSIVYGASQILSRLPQTPLPLSSRWRTTEVREGDFPLSLYLTSGVEDSSPKTIWDRLKVTVLMNTVVIRTAIHTFCGQEKLVDYKRLLECLADQLNMAAEMSSSADNPATWYVIKAFLWTAWQRIRMLFLSLNLQHQLRVGFDHASVPLPAILGQFQFSDEIVTAVEQENQTLQKPGYMCNWAYRLLTAQLSGATMDLRQLFYRYGELWGSRQPRCKDLRPCSGNAPDDCLRFKGAVIVDQSAHDWTCKGRGQCNLIPWDNASYMSVVEAASVCVDPAAQEEGERVTYCEAGSKTLAVSHVWAHGQGGRPEIGINSCLHQRYCTLARKLGCDSYWIDTTCIPEDHNLRKKSIATINRVFRNSRACLVCDRDMMDIDISSLKDDSVPTRSKLQLAESILATVLLCDWNVRAWTILEAVQGRHHILFLCKWNEVIPLHETLETVMQHGSIDIGILFFGAPHLLSMMPEEPFSLFDNQSPIEQTPQEKLLQQKFIPLEHAAELLQHRPASRHGDAFVIWRLLTDTTAFETPQDLWESRDGFSLATGFLISGAQRVQGFKGLSWAPIDPIARKVRGLFHEQTEIYPMMDMQGTVEGKITSNGFRASWKIFRFEMSFRGSQDSYSKGEGFIEELRRVVKVQFQCTQDTVALLRPLAGIKQAEKTGAKKYHTKSLSPFVVVCEFCPEDDGWRWLGVRVWDSENLVPDFETEEILLV